MLQGYISLRVLLDIERTKVPGLHHGKLRCIGVFEELGTMNKLTRQDRPVIPGGLCKHTGSKT